MFFSGVSPTKEKVLFERMEQLGVFEKDVIEKFICSSGKGGQHVNKASTCVYLKHIPTGIEVKVMKERSQSLNRFLAWRLLTDKIEELIKGKESKKQQEIEKLRRQKRKRSKRAKEKMLKGKRLQAGKKALRGKVDMKE